MDVLLTNVLHIPYIDPTLDRCAAVHEHLSCGDVLRQRRLTSQMLPTCGVVHLLCSVESRQDISFNSKMFTEATFKLETNSSLLKKFKDGMALKQTLSSRSAEGIAQETVPYLLWTLSAGEGSGSLARGTTSEKLLKSKERRSFERHASIMSALGLKYSPDEGSDTTHSGHVNYRVEPPIDNLSFEGVVARLAVPSAVSARSTLARISHSVL